MQTRKINIIDKAVCRKYYIDILVKELGTKNPNSNIPTYVSTGDSYKTILRSHNQFITSMGLEMSEENQNMVFVLDSQLDDFGDNTHRGTR